MKKVISTLLLCISLSCSHMFAAYGQIQYVAMNEKLTIDEPGEPEPPSTIKYAVKPSYLKQIQHKIQKLLPEQPKNLKAKIVIAAISSLMLVIAYVLIQEYQYQNQKPISLEQLDEEFDKKIAPKLYKVLKELPGYHDQAKRIKEKYELSD